MRNINLELVEIVNDESKTGKVKLRCKKCGCTWWSLKDSEDRSELWQCPNCKPDKQDLYNDD